MRIKKIRQIQPSVISQWEKKWGWLMLLVLVIISFLSLLFVPLVLLLIYWKLKKWRKRRGI